MGVKPTQRNCWEEMGCGREAGGDQAERCGACPASTAGNWDGLNGGTAGGRICWAVAGTFCEGDVQGTFASKMTSCMTCRFFQEVREEAGPDFVHLPRSPTAESDYEQVTRAYARLHGIYSELRATRTQLRHSERGPTRSWPHPSSTMGSLP